VTPDQVVRAPAIAELEHNHPRRRFVLAVCTFAAEQLRTHQATTTPPASGGPARCSCLRRRGARPPATATSSWPKNVPLDQVAQRCLTLARDGWWQVDPEAIR
jgi:hypothetical protein